MRYVHNLISFALSAALAKRKKM